MKILQTVDIVDVLPVVRLIASQNSLVRACETFFVLYDQLHEYQIHDLPFSLNTG